MSNDHKKYLNQYSINGMSDKDFDLVERFIVFVDADNIPSTLMSKALDIIKDRGRMVSCKVFGDFSRPALAAWKTVCLTYNLQAIMAWHKSGKNSSDLKICQDCVHTMYTHSNIDNYILITGDGDFTTIIQDLKTHGKNVICMGIRSSSSTILQTCSDEFIDLTPITPKQSGSSQKPLLEQQIIRDIKQELDRDPKKNLGALKTRLLLKNPKYTEANFSKSTFKKLVEYLGFTVFYKHVKGREPIGPFVKKK